MSEQLFTPSPSPPRPAPTPTLPAQINAATKRQHVVLNRLIIHRLALALPPKASDPSVLGSGLGAFARIYCMFEESWQELENSNEDDEKHLTGTHDAQLQQWLATLRPEGLSRWSRLRQDLQHISQRVESESDVEIPAQLEILDRMQTDIQANPHTLVAYGWVMYMAIFSGGRWIRQQLANAGPAFWIDDTETMVAEKRDLASLEMRGFSFLSFDGDDDGEDIKNLFKSRLAEAETLLTLQERQDIIDAAQSLFEDCIALVGMLDRAVWWQQVWTHLPLAMVGVATVLVILLLKLIL